MAEYGLKGSHAQCLIALLNCDGLTATELCGFCDKDKAAISRTVSELESGGYIKKILTGPNMYRARLTLTQKGAALAKEVQQKACVAVSKATQGLDKQNIDALYNTLERFAKNLDKIAHEEL